MHLVSSPFVRTLLYIFYAIIINRHVGRDLQLRWVPFDACIMLYNELTLFYLARLNVRSAYLASLPLCYNMTSSTHTMIVRSQTRTPCASALRDATSIFPISDGIVSAMEYMRGEHLHISNLAPSDCATARTRRAGPL